MIIKLENNLPLGNWIWNKKTLKVQKYWKSNLLWAREETSAKKILESNTFSVSFFKKYKQREKNRWPFSCTEQCVALLQHSLFRCLCMQAYQAQKMTTLVASGVERWARKFLFFPGLPPWWCLPRTGRVNWSKSCLRALLWSMKWCTQSIMLNLGGFGLKDHVVIFLPSYMRVPWVSTQRD